MSSEDNKRTIRQYWAAVNSRDAKAATAYWAAKTINHGKERDISDLENLHESLVQVYEHVTVHEIIAEDDWVVCRITVDGRHAVRPSVPFDSGIYQLTKPDGRPFSFQHIHMFRLVEGKIKEHWANRDDLLAARQLGLDLAEK